MANKRSGNGTHIYISAGGGGEVRSEATKKRSPSSVIMPVIGLAALGVAAYFVWQWYEKSKCNPGIDTTRCVNGNEQECTPFLMEALGIYMWQNNGYPCTPGGYGGMYQTRMY